MTTYSTTTALTFSANLLANLADTSLHPELRQVLVTDGIPPATYLQQGQVVWLGDVKSTRQWAGIQNPVRPQNEEYTIEVYISCIAPSVPNDTKGQVILTEQANTIFKSIEQELRTNPQQGVDGDGGTGGWVIESHIGGYELSKNVNDTARESCIKAEISVKARL